MKTIATTADVADFIAAVPDPRRRAEAELVDALHRRITDCTPKLWGSSIIGYGSYDYRYDSGCEGTSCRAGFSPRKGAMTIYLMGTYGDHHAAADALFARLGKHKLGKACLYINRLDQVDMVVLEQLVRLSWDAMNAKYPA